MALSRRSFLSMAAAAGIAPASRVAAPTGLDLLTTARLLEPMDAIAGFAVVKTEAAFVLHETKIAKPVLYMGIATSADGADLARIGVQPSLYTDDAVQRVNAMSRAVGGPVDALGRDTDVGVGDTATLLGPDAPEIEPWREERPALEVLYMSGYTDDAIAHHGVLEEGTAYIEKPFRPGELLQKVWEVLSNGSGGGVGGS